MGVRINIDDFDLDKYHHLDSSFFEEYDWILLERGDSKAIKIFPRVYPSKFHVGTMHMEGGLSMEESWILSISDLKYLFERTHNSEKKKALLSEFVKDLL